MMNFVCSSHKTTLWKDLQYSARVVWISIESQINLSWSTEEKDWFGTTWRVNNGKMIPIRQDSLSPGLSFTLTELLVNPSPLPFLLSTSSLLVLQTELFCVAAQGSLKPKTRFFSSTCFFFFGSVVKL